MGVGTACLLALLSGPRAGAASSRASKIEQFAQRWLGTPYRWGGTSRSGIDCSAFLRRMYRDLFDIELPRTTRQQIDLGIDITADPERLSRLLQPGDLIFYVDRTGTPNHVVVYAGQGRITHSVSGRGVVIDPLRKAYGRRIVARRLLVPRADDGGDTAGFEPVPAAGPLMAFELPCPNSIRAKAREVRRYRKRPLEDLRVLGDRAICDFKALADALRLERAPVAADNARRLDAHAEWLNSIEALKGTIGRGW